MTLLGILFMVIAIAPYFPLGAFNSADYQSNARYAESAHRPKMKLGFTIVCFLIGLTILLIF